MAEQGNRTFLTNMYDPEVLADMISAKLDKKIRVTPFAKIDRTLEGRAGGTITVPRYNYIGAATVVGEGEEIPEAKLTTAHSDYTIHKIAKSVILTDEAVLSGYGDPAGEATKQLALSIADYIDTEAMGELAKASRLFEASTKISYNNVVDGIATFGEEINSPKVIFVHPDQVATLRKDANFISADKYGAGTNVVMYGEVGMISNARVVSSKRVAKNEFGYQATTSDATGAKLVVASGATSAEVNIGDITNTFPATYEPEAGDYVLAVATGTYYVNPIVKLDNDDETEDAVSALTVFLKRDTNVEIDRQSKKRQTEISVDKNYVVALTDDSKVALLFSKV